MSCGRRLARASRERRSSCSGASPRRQRSAADEAGKAYLAECPVTSPDGRFPLPAPRTRQRLAAVGGADYAGAPRAGARSQRRRGPRSIGPGPSRCVIGWRARPETFAARPEASAACGFSDLRAGFVLRDESGRRQRSRALHGSGRAAPEHDAGSPAPGTRPPPLEILRSTNWARISEEPVVGCGRGDAGAGTRGRDSASASRLAISTPTSTSSSFVPIVATTCRSPLGRVLTWARCGSRRPTTRSRGPGTSRGSSARCYRSRPAGGSGATSSVRWPRHLVLPRRQPDRHKRETACHRDG
jgi:hypothetical protein